VSRYFKIDRLDRRRSSHSIAVPAKISQPSKMWSNSRGASEGLLPGRDFLGPALLLLLSPTFALTLYHVVAHLDGSLVLLLVDFKRKGPVGFFLELWLNFR